MEDEHKERIKLLSRKGFIRVAVEQGCQPVPVYHFGNSQLLFILGKALEGLSRAIRASLVITYGKFGLPLPKRVPIMMVRHPPACPLIATHCTLPNDCKTIKFEITRQCVRKFLLRASTPAPRAPNCHESRFPLTTCVPGWGVHVGTGGGRADQAQEACAHRPGLQR